MTISTMRQFVGWLSADIPELHNVEVPRLADSLDRFLAKVEKPAETPEAQRLIAEMQETLAKITPGEWFIDTESGDFMRIRSGHRVHSICAIAGSVLDPTEGCTQITAVDEANAEFIAKASRLLRQCLSLLTAQEERVLMIAGLVNSYHNDGTTLSAEDTLRAIADALGEALSPSPVSGEEQQ